MLLAPGVGGLDDPAFGNKARIVAPVDCQILARAADAIAKYRVGPAQPAMKRLRIGIDQQLIGVETVPIGGIVRSVDPVAIKQAGARIRQIDVPDLVGVFGQFNPRFFVQAGVVEQTQLDFLGMSRKKSEIHALAVPRRS